MELKQDRTGFPMLRVEPLDAYLGWLPVTKIQFEQFLCETADDRFGPRWYDEVLSLNPRIAPSGIQPSNYWRSLLTGVLPAEAECFARWMGEGYRLPTCEEWTTAFDHLRRAAPNRMEWERVLSGVAPRCLTLLDAMDQASTAAAREAGYERRLAEQMLLRLGVMEWVQVTSGEQRWGGMGEVAPGLAGLLFDPTMGEPHLLHYPDKERISFYGFRLLLEEER